MHSVIPSKAQRTKPSDFEGSDTFFFSNICFIKYCSEQTRLKLMIPENFMYKCTQETEVQLRASGYIST